MGNPSSICLQRNLRKHYQQIEQNTPESWNFGNCSETEWQEGSQLERNSPNCQPSCRAGKGREMKMEQKGS